MVTTVLFRSHLEHLGSDQHSLKSTGAGVRFVQIGMLSRSAYLSVRFWREYPSDHAPHYVYLKSHVR